MSRILPKSQRERNRYIVFKLHCRDCFEKVSVAKAIQKRHLNLYGEIGSSEHNLWLMHWDKDKSMGVVKVNHKSVEPVRAMLTMVSDVDRKKVMIETVITCGTLKKARQAI